MAFKNLNPAEDTITTQITVTKGFFDGVNLTKISSLEEEFLQYINTNCKNVLDELSKGILNDKSLKIIEDSAKKIAANYK